jgi:hypothetical protein
LIHTLFSRWNVPKADVLQESLRVFAGDFDFNPDTIELSPNQYKPLKDLLPTYSETSGLHRLEQPQIHLCLQHRYKTTIRPRGNLAALVGFTDPT